MGITSIEDNNVLHNCNNVNSNLSIFTEFEELETQIKHINLKDSKFDLYDLLKSRKVMKTILLYLNINQLSSKIDYRREICSKSKSTFNILCIDMTKLDSFYLYAQFEIQVYQYLLYNG